MSLCTESLRQRGSSWLSSPSQQPSSEVPDTFYQAQLSAIQSGCRRRRDGRVGRVAMSINSYMPMRLCLHGQHAPLGVGAIRQAALLGPLLKLEPSGRSSAQAALEGCAWLWESAGAAADKAPAPAPSAPGGGGVSP